MQLCASVIHTFIQHVAQSIDLTRIIFNYPSSFFYKRRLALEIITTFSYIYILFMYEHYLLG